MRSRLPVAGFTVQPEVSPVAREHVASPQKCRREIIILIRVASDFDVPEYRPHVLVLQAALIGFRREGSRFVQDASRLSEGRCATLPSLGHGRFFLRGP